MTRHVESSPMFRLDAVGKSYGQVVALAPVSLEIARGERVAVVGPSGSGKTTLLNLLAGAIEPDGGQLLIGGRPADRLRPGRDRSRLVGIMAQSFDLVESLAVVHNVLAGRLGEWGLVRSLTSLIVPREVTAARSALDRVGIADKLFEKTHRLSGGEKQRVALARLLIQRPQAVLADEPVASLDPARADDLIGMLIRLANEEGQTLVVSLHTVSLALKHFSRVIALRKGFVQFDRPVEDVSDKDLEALYALGKETATGA